MPKGYDWCSAETFYKLVNEKKIIEKGVWFIFKSPIKIYKKYPLAQTCLYGHDWGSSYQILQDSYANGRVVIEKC